MTTENGRMLGRYQLLFMLGQGGMGEVHLARLTGAAGFEKLCIVKTVLPNLMGDQNFIDRFHHEARVLVQLTHSNIAQVYDMGEVNGTLYMAIEYVPGVDLSRVETRIERQAATMPIPTAVFIAQKICEALGYAHRKVGADGQPLGIVHRDVSPQNVMVSYEGEVKVIDFGLAKSTARSKHTLPSTVMGKLGYMSPEQALAKPVDHRSDIFSAGIVIWEMLAGRSMYAGGTMSEMVAQMAVAEVPSLVAANPTISPALEQIVMRALAKEPSARYQRADDFARALNEMAVRENLTVGAEDVGNYVRAMCPEEFAAERQLQSKLSVMRRKGAVPEVQAADPELEGTFMRPSGSVAPKETASGQVMTPAMRAMSVIAPSAPSGGVKVKSLSGQKPKSIAPVAPSPDDDEPIVPPAKSKLPLVIGLLVALIVLAGGGLYATGGAGGAEVKKDPVEVPVKVADPVVAKDPEPVKDPEPARDPEPVKAPEPAVEVPKETITVDGKVWKVIKKGGEDLLILDKNDKLSEGDRVSLVGEPGEDGKRPLYGHGAVMKVTGSLATLLFDDDEKLPEKVFAARDSAPKRPIVKRDPTKTTDGTKTEPVATADPVKIEPVKTEPVKEPEPVKETVAPVGEDPRKPKPVQLNGSIRVVQSGILGNRAVFLQSQMALTLSNCEVRLPSNQFFQMGNRTIGPRDTVKIALNKFQNDKRAAPEPFKDNWGAVYCREGTGYWKTTYDK